MIEKALLWAYMKEFIYAGIRDIVLKQAAYEANNENTWSRVGGCVRSYVDRLVAMNYLHEVNVICDRTVNTQETIEANEFHLKFLWKVNESDEFTVVDFDIMPDQGCVSSEVSVEIL